MINETIDYYNKNAKQYIELTREVSSEDREEMLLKYLQPGAYILDVGCGSGKDSKSLIEKGYKVCSIDGSEQMAKLASKYIGREGICNSTADAIYASAVLLHIPRKEQKSVLEKLAKAVKKNGYLYINYKHGEFEGIRDGRYYTDYTIELFEGLIKSIKNLKLIEYKIMIDELGRGNNWLNIILKKE